MAIKIGDRVTTLEFGPGTIEGLEDGIAIVRLEGYGRMRIRENPIALQLLAGGSRPTRPIGDPPRQDPKSTPAPSEPEYHEPAAETEPLDEGYQALESLRFGLVPTTRLRDLTIGYSSLDKWIKNQLPCSHNKEPRVAEISGPYGTGKSHASAVVREVARQHNYLTASVEVDGLSISLSDPAKLLYALWSTLRGDGLDSATPVLDLYLQAIERSKLTPSIAPVGIDRVKDNFGIVRRLKTRNLLDGHGEAMDGILSSSDELTAAEVKKAICAEDSISASEIPIKPMIGRKVAERPYDFIESIVGTAAVAQLAGYAGLVITVDEFEVEYHLSPAGQRRVRDLLSVLAQYLAGETRHRPKPVALFFATAGQDEHAGDTVVDALINRTGGGRYELQPMSAQDRSTLGKRIFDLYVETYGVGDSFQWRIVEDVERIVEQDGLGDSGLVRAFIKQMMTSLDLSYGPPECQPRQL